MLEFVEDKARIFFLVTLYALFFLYISNRNNPVIERRSIVWFHKSISFAIHPRMLKPM